MAPDLRSAPAAEPLLGALVPVVIRGVTGGVGGGLDERPAEVLRTVLGERPSIVAATRLADEWAEVGVSGQLLGLANRPMSPISVAIV
jgi:hypothetical protein